MKTSSSLTSTIPTDEMQGDPREIAALLVAEARLSDPDIAERVGVTIKTLNYWKSKPEFQRRVESHGDSLRMHNLDILIADKRQRLIRLNRDWQKLQSVVESRAKAVVESGIRVPGADTGLLIQVGKVWKVDRELLDSVRELEEAAAVEMGHRAKEAPVAAPIGNKVMVVLPGSSLSGTVEIRQAPGIPAPETRQILPGEIVVE